MNTASLRHACAVGTALFLAANTAHAGRSCEAVAPTVDAVQRSMRLAEHTAQKLDQSGAQVVLLARIGQDLSAYGLRYSHFGFAYRAQEGAPWLVMHKLNQCGTATSDIYRQGLGEFFLDDMFEYEAAMVIPTPEVQAKLLPALQDDARVAQLHTSAYNMLAYPWAVKYQQSNQWAIETLAMTQDPAASTREKAQSWLKLHDYQPTTLKINAMKRLGGRITAANIAFDDHPNEKRFSDRIETVTVDSVFAWLNRSGMGGAIQTVR
jgi:hypothetical protein